MRRRIWLWESAAVAAVLAAAPLAAQTTNQVTPGTATPAPTPTPTPTPAPPAGNAVGPPQLRDFTLGGNVTQPAQPATPTPSPAPGAAPASRDPAPSTAAPRTSAPARIAPPPSSPAPRAPAVAAPDSNPDASAVTVDLPPPTAAPRATGPLEPPVDAATRRTPAADASGSAWWPWLAALLAVALGGGLLLWLRQRNGGEAGAADKVALGGIVASPEVAPVLPRAASAPPRPAPRAPLYPPPGAPIPAAAPPPPPPPAPAAPPPVADGIVSSRLKPELGFELIPIRAETDAAEGAALTFDLILVNRGSAPARDVLVEVQLINAGPGVDAEVGRFFMQPAGDGERLPLIPPMGRVALRTRLGMSGATATPLVVAGRKLFVPVVAVNAMYRWSGGELRDSSSFLVGRGDAEGGKMAPFRLDLGARSWSGLGARLHSTGLQH